MDTLSRFHSVTCYYDSSHYQEFVVRVSSLHMSGDVPGTFCTCALRKSAPILDLIDYIAIVDSGTNHRIDGLAPWYFWPNASAGWDSIYNIGWDGFLSQVEGAGTAAGTPVDVIIRAHFPPGYAYVPMYDDLLFTIMGWGSWNDTIQRPNSDRWWADWPRDSNFHFIPIISPSSFFTSLDADLQYVATDPATVFAGLAIYPNPAVDALHLRMPDPRFAFSSVDIYDANGHVVMQGRSAYGNAMDLDVTALEPGAYFLRIGSAKGNVTRKIIIRD